WWSVSAARSRSPRPSPRRRRGRTGSPRPATASARRAFPAGSTPWCSSSTKTSRRCAIWRGAWRRPRRRARSRRPRSSWGGCWCRSPSCSTTRRPRSRCGGSAARRSRSGCSTTSSAWPTRTAASATCWSRSPRSRPRRARRCGARTRRRMDNLGRCIADVENSGESVFRALVNTRVSLLNILSPSF
uniref:Uncharacterized protein n=1 Tax=Aegilops tauschii subsp. strangulata TaxID=200361 RepID=A0A453P964_AEGTS